MKSLKMCRQTALVIGAALLATVLIGTANHAYALCADNGGIPLACAVRGVMGTQYCVKNQLTPCVAPPSPPPPSPRIFGGTPCDDFNGIVINCGDVSPTTNSYRPKDIDVVGHSVSGKILSLAVSATDPQRLYAGSFSGVWRSDDGGKSWKQLTRPQPLAQPPFSPDLSPGALTGTGGSSLFPGAQGRTDVFAGALRVPNVFEVVVSPVNKDLVLAAIGYDTRTAVNLENGIYRSSDGGDSWRLVHQFSCPGSDGTSGQIVFAPDNPTLLYAAGNCSVAMSKDAGVTWTEVIIPGGKIWYLAVAPQEVSSASGGFPPVSFRRVYGAGDNQIWYSRNGGNSWIKDLSPTLTQIGSMLAPPFGRYPDVGGGNGSQVLAVEPGHPDHIYLAVPALANGPSYYHPKSWGVDGVDCNKRIPVCGEGSLWLGDYSKFSPGQAAIWTQQPGPPTYYGGSTDSGNVYVVTKIIATGYLVFFSDRSHVHVSVGPPTARGWHRLDGRDASQGQCEGCSGNDTNCNELFLHVDPHAFAVSSDFDMALTRPICRVGPTPSPYDKNSVLDKSAAGTMWMANDGGVYYSVRKVDMDGGFSWKLASGLATLQPESGLAAVKLPGKPPALYMGTRDNDNFFTLDGGFEWGNPLNGRECGDCGPWFSDPAQPNRVLVFNRKCCGLENTLWSLYVNPSPDAYPDPSVASHHHPHPLPYPDRDDGGNVAEMATGKGYRPVILTLSGENRLDDSDFIIIEQGSGNEVFPNGARWVARTTQLSKIQSASDWQTKASRQGPFFSSDMEQANVVQASGGHGDPVFFVSDADATQGLWWWKKGENAWNRIVPAKDGSAKIARRFFVDPYNPDTIYIIDQDGIKRTDTRGSSICPIIAPCVPSWRPDALLHNAVTENQSFSLEVNTQFEILSQDGVSAVITDMVFNSVERNTRFTLGNAGVFVTLDGKSWSRLLSTTALPGHPAAGYFDRSSRAFYVAMNGRGILRLSPIPPPP